MKLHPSMMLMLAACLFLVSCGGEPVPGDSSGNPEADQRATMRVGGDVEGGKSTPEKTLFARLGGADGIRRIVDDVADRVIADPRVNFQRRGVRRGLLALHDSPWAASPENIKYFKDRFVQFLTLASGGPTEYGGREMAEVHKGMKITNNEFDAMVGDIKTSMERLDFAKREIRDVLAIIETTRKQIVEES